MSWICAPDLIRRAVPRYTSYPTAVDFSDAVGIAHQAAALEAVPAEAPLSLYLHIPFCDSICWYCGCNTGANNRPQRLARYVEALITEIATVAAYLGGRGRVRTIHFGGGSPNALTPEQLGSILRALSCQLPGAATAQKALEADPRGLDSAYCAALGALGFDRISLGAQTFAAPVQAAINRIQPFAQVAQAAKDLRSAGIAHLNLDLMYGLPKQSAADLETSIAQALTLRPDRIALFGYAHLPLALPRQRLIRDDDLPGPEARFDQSLLAHAQLTGAGYQAIGFDHFAVPEDSLALAAREGRLRRNFQGFTDDQADHVIGLGASSISQFPGLLVQNEKASGSYALRAQMGRLTGCRGVVRSVDDRLRARAIEMLLCQGAVDTGMLCRRFGLPETTLDSALVAAGPLIERSLAHLEGRRLSVPPEARAFARLVAQLFDARHGQPSVRFSKAV